MNAAVRSSAEEVEKRRHLLRFPHFLPFCMKHCGNDYDLQKFYNEEDEK